MKQFYLHRPRDIQEIRMNLQGTGYPRDLAEDAAKTAEPLPATRN